MVTSLPPLLNPLFSKNSSGKVKSGRFQALFNACFRQCPVNYIETSISKQKGGYALFASHEYFGRYTFSIGGTSKVLEEWIDNNRNALHHAKIVRVGVRDKQDYGGSVWFNVE